MSQEPIEPDPHPPTPPPAEGELLSLVYDRQRSLARHMMSRERPGQTLQATALVHEAYMRLSREDPSRWKDRKHFYLVAAQAMRRILVDRARRKRSRAEVTSGGVGQITPAQVFTMSAEDVDLVNLDEALRRLSDEDPRAAQLVALRFFAGLSLEDAGETLGISRSTAKRDWSYVKAWLRSELGGGEGTDHTDETS